MKHSSTLFLRVVVIFLGITVLAICIFVLPLWINSADLVSYRPILLGMYVPAIPFFFALYQALKLLTYIDKNKAFSNLSVMTLKNIKYCANIITALYTAGLPYIFYVANKDHSRGVIITGLVVIFASIVVATFAAVLQKLLQDALDIKSENDLTI